jgi:hypothetical protein
MLSGEAESGVGVLKMNSRILEPAELKRLDKQEKELHAKVIGVGKGKQETRVITMPRTAWRRMSPMPMSMLLRVSMTVTLTLSGETQMRTGLVVGGNRETMKSQLCFFVH